jgi:hypothetical protein
MRPATATAIEQVGQEIAKNAGRFVNEQLLAMQDFAQGKVDARTVLQLVNAGVISANIARRMLGFEEMEAKEEALAKLEYEAAIYAQPRTFTVKPPQHPTENVCVSAVSLPYNLNNSNCASFTCPITYPYVPGSGLMANVTPEPTSPPLDSIQAMVEAWKAHTFEKQFGRNEPIKEPEPELKVEVVPLFAKRRIRLID